MCCSGMTVRKSFADASGSDLLQSIISWERRRPSWAASRRRRRAHNISATANLSDCLAVRTRSNGPRRPMHRGHRFTA